MKSSRGFTLVELMVSMVIGLVLIGAVISIVLSFHQSYKTNTALAELQNNASYGFELMARSLREAGVPVCGETTNVANVLRTGPNGTGSDWWANWSQPIIGYGIGDPDPDLPKLTGNGQPVPGNDSLHIIDAQGGGMVSVNVHDPNAASFAIDSPVGLKSGDIAMICSPGHAAIFQVTTYNGVNTVTHNTGKSVSPGNCTKNLAYPTDCSSVTSGTDYQFPHGSILTRLNPVIWYIGVNAAGSNSLFTTTLSTDSKGDAVVTPQEMVRGVSSMTISYHFPGLAGYVPAAAVGAANWASVDAVRVSLTLSSTDQRAGSNNSPLERSMVTTIALRNRLD